MLRLSQVFQKLNNLRMSATYLYHHNLNFTGVKLFSAAFQTEFKQFKSL